MNSLSNKILNIIIAFIAIKLFSFLLIFISYIHIAQYMILVIFWNVHEYKFSKKFIN